MFQWKDLLCADTLCQKEKAPSSWEDYPMDPFEQDYREIINSVSFRRLQDKSQVYQLGNGDFVRTRLTHSLEVSTIAKQLGIMLVFNEKWNHIPVFHDMPIDYARALPTVLASAGLLHDMGNPPFGHEGEYAIGTWFRDSLERDDFTFCERPIRDVLSEQMKADLCNFEGNAQVIRMLAKSRFLFDEQEANVSLATISTLIKYPVSSVVMDRNNPDHRAQKFGFFYSEEDFVKFLRQKTGISVPDEPFARNPLTFLLEAADDIAYVASDLEDAVAKKEFTIHQLVGFMRRQIDALPKEGDEQHQMQLLTVEGILNNLVLRLEKCNGGELEEMAAFRNWINYLRNWLMYVTACSFVQHWEAIMNGTFRDELLDGSMHKYTIRILKQEMRTNVYPRLGDVHLSVHKILTELTERFATAVIHWTVQKELDPADLYTVQMIPERLKTVYMLERGDDEAANLYLRFRMATDYIASMTDTYARDLYRKLNALSV